MEDMTEKELITVLIDKYTDLQRIKRANNGWKIRSWSIRSK